MRKRQTERWLGLWALVLLVAATPEASGTQKPFRNVTDETGRIVEVPSEVRRIVSLAPNLTETIYALGAQNRLVGDTAFCDYPPAARQKPHVGAPVNPSLEAIVALHPDLVLATTAINRRETVEALERLRVAVYATDPHTVEGMLDSVERIANLIGEGAEGEALKKRLDARLDALREQLGNRPKKRVLFVVWEDPLITVGQKTFIADALGWAGAESVIQSRENWPQISLEEVARLKPDYLLFSSDRSDSASKTLADLRSRPAWRDLSAVREGHIAVISEAVEKPSPRLVDAIEQLARELHPGAFAGEVDKKAAAPETRRKSSSRRENGACEGRGG